MKTTAFVGVLLPVAWILYRFWDNDLGPRPVTEVIHFSGDWAVRLLWITLAVSPFARIFRSGKLLLPRRLLGIASFAYVFAHLFLYVVDQKFDLITVASEIVLRFYLTIGFVAVVGLAVLAATSTDKMCGRLGRRWNSLHKLVYPIAILAVIHFLLQRKNDIYQPTLMLGFLIWLLGYRIMQRRTREVSLISLTGLAIVSAALTAVFEVGWYYFRTGVQAQHVFWANFDFEYEFRPVWWVLAAGISVVVAAWLWRIRPQIKRANTPRASSGATRVQSAS
ncbi:MAG TPA: protein-methionine-sulfoxide reductase heme-binding subunit MsrQ [Xanthobacteraceae bacterium]|nr:protein-methionine-sulfoxide reductase heme-binding subunit MsrQ [Xanthobacteraceae bacterium]